MDAVLTHAIALFHQQQYWECHEVLEASWLRAPHKSPERHLLQAIIQIAAGCLKRAEHKDAPARSLLAKALAHLARVPDACLEIDVRRLEREATAFLERASDAPPSLATARA